MGNPRQIPIVAETCGCCAIGHDFDALVEKSKQTGAQYALCKPCVKGYHVRYDPDLQVTPEDIRNAHQRIGIR